MTPQTTFKNDVIYFCQMPRRDEGLFDKAEAVTRRLLDRLGSRFQGAGGPEPEQRLSPKKISDLLLALEREIELHLEPSDDREQHLAPDRFEVRLTYEETSDLSEQYMKAVAEELTNEVQEYIGNRRYKTRRPIVVDVSRDVLARDTVVKSSVGSDGSREGSDKPVKQTERRTIVLQPPGGSPLSFDLSPDSGTFSIGRAAGNTLRVDHPSVSRTHCSIALKAAGAVVVSDLNSANGTSVNGRPLLAGESLAINEHDTISVGDIVIEVLELS
jgi:hypothetical protein